MLADINMGKVLIAWIFSHYECLAEATSAQLSYICLPAYCKKNSHVYLLQRNFHSKEFRGPHAL